MNFAEIANGRISVWAQTLEKFLARWAPFVLVLTALIYYSTYYRTGLNLGGEGGLNAVLAMRLMEGQRPIVDTFLGYNLLWFYPLVALFKITGPDYIAMRFFFFALCILNALLGFGIVRAVTRQAWLATAVGVILVLVPGMMFRNYMGLIGVLPMFAFLKGYVFPASSTRRQIARMGFVGVALSITFLLRIEPSLLLCLIWLGLAILYPLGARDHFTTRLRTTFLGTLLGVVLLVGIHGAVTWHAYERGFGTAFLDQYTNYIGMLRYELQREIQKLSPPPTPAISTSSTANAAPNPSITPAPKSDEGRDARLARPPLLKIWQAERPSNRFLGLGMYFPVFWISGFVTVAALLLGVSIFRGDEKSKAHALVILVTTGCALTLFPQYFFFRPDAPHFSEFMIPFLPAVACSAYAFWKSAYDARSHIWRTSAWIAVILSALLVPIYFKAIMPREEAGTIILYDELAEFRGLNNVHVKVLPEDAPVLAGLRDAVLNHAAPREYVICYPYSPTINFMTDRPSYEYDLYIDDTVAGGSFQNEAKERIEKFRPAVIVIDNRAINHTERSRFKNWAADLTAFISDTYQSVGNFEVGGREIEVYARPDKVRP